MAKYEDRLRRSAKVRFGISAVIFLCLVIFVIIPSWQKLTNENGQLAELKTKIADTESSLELNRDSYRDLKEDYAYRAEVDQKAITTALPENAEQTTIVREIEAYTNQLAGSNRTLVLNSINFNKPVKKDDIDYVVLPFKMSLTTTKENLMGLLRYLEHTGSITSGSTNAGRLLDVQDIDIQVSDSDANGIGTITADLMVNAYILPTKTETTDTSTSKQN
ncbi:MAG: hypothetical protein PHO48_02450 [Candidatus Gracilibacteria bacterium]|nr:hypothetical protein [Candidatus Gracilibacteria bacterium]MDD5178649.1 hypothetical protein [Candidatus Gracilibacteria bacterium]